MTTGDPKLCGRCGGELFTAGRYEICKGCGERADMTEFAFKPVRLQCKCTTFEPDELLHIETSPQGIKVLWCTKCHGQRCDVGVTKDAPPIEDVLRYQHTMDAVEAQKDRVLEDALREEREASEVEQELVAIIAKGIEERMRPYLMGKVINPEWQGDVKLRKEHKELLKTSNDALEMLWRFVDIVNEVPRHGNVFDRGKEALMKAHDLKEFLKDAVDRGESLADRVRELERGEDANLAGQLADARKEVEILRKWAAPEHQRFADSELNKLRSKVNPG